MSERVTIVAPTDPQLDYIASLCEERGIEKLRRHAFPISVEPLEPIENEKVLSRDEARAVLAALAAETAARREAERERADYRLDWVRMKEREQDLEADLAAARQALEDFANPQHWGIDRSFHPPKAVWIGTYETGPVEHARAALASQPGEPPPPSEPRVALAVCADHPDEIEYPDSGCAKCAAGAPTE